MCFIIKIRNFPCMKETDREREGDGKGQMKEKLSQVRFRINHCLHFDS